MSYLDQALPLARSLGVTEAYEPVLAWRERAAALDAQLTELRAAGERARARLVKDVAERPLAPADVLARLAESAGWEFDSPASKVVVAAIAACHQQADAATVSGAPALFEALRHLVDSLVGESVALTAKLPREVTGERAAYAAGEAVFGAWVRLEELAGRWIAAHDLAEVLRRAGWVPGPPHRHKSALRAMGWTRFRYPDRLPPGWVNQPQPLKIGLAKSAGAEPGLYGWDEAEQRLAAHDRRTGRADVHVMNQVTVHKTAFDAAVAMQVAANTPVPPPPRR